MAYTDRPISDVRWHLRRLADLEDGARYNVESYRESLDIVIQFLQDLRASLSEECLHA